MSQNEALANAFILFAPIAIGLLVGIYGVQATFHPLEFRLSILALYALGLALFLAAKASLVRQGHRFTFGSSLMSPRNRRAYRAGYALMGFAVLGTIVLLNIAVVPPVRDDPRQWIEGVARYERDPVEASEER